jgi:hypothetical protein
MFGIGHRALPWRLSFCSPHNRVRGGRRGGDADRLAGEGGRHRGLARRRWRYGVGSVAQVRLAASYISIEVGRSLTQLALAAPPFRFRASAWGQSSFARRRTRQRPGYSRCAAISSLVNSITGFTSLSWISSHWA